MTLPEGPDLTTYSDEELMEERDFLLRSLQDLDEEHQAGDVEEGDYAVLKDGYTARAAAVLRTLDRRRVDAERAATADQAPSVTSPTAETAPAPPRPRWRPRTLAIGGAVVVFAIGAGLLVARSSGQRLPGDTVSGSVPNNKVQQLLAQADAEFQRSDVIGSLKTLQQVLAIDPRNVVALAQEGWVLAISGNSTHEQAIIDRGLGLIRQAESIDGTYAAAHFYAGSVLLNEGKPKDAVTEFEEYLADDSSSSTAALVRGDLQTAQAEAAGQLPAGASEAPTTVPGRPTVSVPGGTSVPTSAP